MNNEQIACNNWEKIGYLKAMEKIKKIIEEEINEAFRGVPEKSQTRAVLYVLKKQILMKLGDKK